MIQRDEDNGHIKVRKLLYGKDKRKGLVCPITTKGFRYLQSLGILSWMEDISSDKRIGLFAEDVNDSRLLRLSRMASASIMAWAAGATCTLPIFTSANLDEDLDGNSDECKDLAANSEQDSFDYPEVDDDFFMDGHELYGDEDFGFEDESDFGESRPGKCVSTQRCEPQPS